ncbi:hypothetical protein KR018_003922 [Drosophila ironensis]|nr:hypothetical protein KR018_003922 [Drosophila ironensis]
MPDYYTWTYPDIPPNVVQELLQLKPGLPVVGIVGRSRCKHANKMCAFGMEPPADHVPVEGQVQWYYKPGTSCLLMHFESSYDEALTGQMIEDSMKETSAKAFDFDSFYERMRCRFLRTLLMALHTCHIVVYVETGPTFDPTLVTVFQLLKFTREQQLPLFLPHLLRDTPAARLGEKARLCAPRMLFLFENYPGDMAKTRECVSAFESQTEDSIYELLRRHNIVTNSSSTSMLALTNNKQFVFFNAHEELHVDHLQKAIECLKETLFKPETKEEDEEQELLDLAPFEGFVKPFRPVGKPREGDEQQFKRQHTAWNFLQKHIQDVLHSSFDEGSFKQLPQLRQFHLLGYKDWQDCRDALNKVLVDNAKDPNYETKNEDYKIFLHNFEDSLNYEKKFWNHLCELGLKKGIASYMNAAPANYGTATHKQLLADATVAFREDGRGPPAEAALAKMTAVCLKHWQDGRQQCEKLSLRSQPCTMPKNLPHDKHSSGVIHVSSCNCGRTQGRREDPFNLRQANFDFYEHMAKTCNLCVKVKQYQFAIFEPSISDYRAAAFDAAFPLLQQDKGFLLEAEEDDSWEEVEDGESGTQEDEDKTEAVHCSQPLSLTFGSDLNMSIEGFGASLNTSMASSELTISDQDRDSTSSGSSSVNSGNELVLQIKEPAKKEAAPANAYSTSTTEYLPGLVHAASNFGLLPLFPSWSLACVGPSSIYSHNTGLQEHFQSGFLSGANFLLPWDVLLRLVQAPKPSQHTGKKQPRWKKHGDRLALKIFVGMEYECSRGHRFMMCASDRVLRGGADIERETCSKMVHSNMPLYYPCPCRSQSNQLAQLMRIHVVTPKAPVNIIVDPKVCVGKYTFTLGTHTPPRLSQSAYWILRLPFVYQGDNVLIAPPEKLEPDNMMAGGYLMPGMFGVAETDPSVDLNEPGRTVASATGSYTRI